MNTELLIGGRNISLLFYEATVIHANKYSEAKGGFGHLPVFSTLHCDLVFRSLESGKDSKVYMKNLDLPVYNGQEVTVFTAGSVILGFIDNQTKKYYYTVSDLTKRLGYGFQLYWFVLLAAAASAFFYIYFGRFNIFTLYSLVGALLLFYIQKWVWNHKIREKIDSYMQS